MEGRPSTTTASVCILPIRRWPTHLHRPPLRNHGSRSDPRDNGAALPPRASARWTCGDAALDHATAERRCMGRAAGRRREQGLVARPFYAREPLSDNLGAAVGAMLDLLNDRAAGGSYPAMLGRGSSDRAGNYWVQTEIPSFIARRCSCHEAKRRDGQNGDQPNSNWHGDSSSTART